MHFHFPAADDNLFERAKKIIDTLVAHNARLRYIFGPVNLAIDYSRFNYFCNCLRFT